MLRFGWARSKSPLPVFIPVTPPGRLIYAIGDIHGRIDLLRRLMAIIADDRALQAVDARPVLVFLGDYVDRGGESNQVLSQMVKLQNDPTYEVVALRGNHDQIMLDFLEQPQLGRMWINYGGGATLRSYGLTPPRLTDEAGWLATSSQLASALPAEHLAFLKATQLYTTFGDYVFVHAGVRPNVALEAQQEHDLMSIRDQFVQARDPAPGRLVVFGHTPFDKPLVSDDKIGIDTGACMTGVLTALALCNGTRRFLQTVESAQTWPLPDYGACIETSSRRL